MNTTQSQAPSLTMWLGTFREHVRLHPGIATVCCLPLQRAVLVLLTLGLVHMTGGGMSPSVQYALMMVLDMTLG